MQGPVDRLVQFELLWAKDLLPLLPGPGCELSILCFVGLNNSYKQLSLRSRQPIRPLRNLGSRKINNCGQRNLDYLTPTPVFGDIYLWMFLCFFPLIVYFYPRAALVLTQPCPHAYLCMRQTGKFITLPAMWKCLCQVNCCKLLSNDLSKHCCFSYQKV